MFADSVSNVGTSHVSQRRRSNRFSEKTPLDALLSEKLNEIINEGVLDSILPFICAANLSTQSARSVVNHVCGLKTKQNGNVKFPSPRLNSVAVENHFTNATTNESTSILTVPNKDRHIRRKSNQPTGLLSEYEH